MPLLLQQNILEETKIAVWKIEEAEPFFLQKVKLLQTIHHPHKRLQHLAGRYLLHMLEPQFPFGNIQINSARKPFLPMQEYQFSISHCGDYAAVIMSKQSRVGIDIELFSPKTEKVKHKFLNEAELQQLQFLPILFPHSFTLIQLYTLYWCAKEAVYKWWGNGKIDFKNDIQIRSVNLLEHSISVSFCKDDLAIPLHLRFTILNELVVVWLTSVKKH